MAPYRSVAALGLAALLLPAPAAAEDLSARKVHLMYYSRAGGNWLFRGNMPELDKAFPYSTLMGIFANETANVAGVPQVPNGTLIDIYSFDNILDSKDTQYESDFAKAHPDLASVTFWPLVGQLLSPKDFSPSEQAALVKNDSLLWAIDQLPTRLEKLDQLVDTVYAAPRAFYIHCEAGCDRTGEFSASWYMRFGYLGALLNQTAAIQLDTLDCGRLPYNVSVYAAQWYCVYLKNELGIDATPCY